MAVVQDRVSISFESLLNMIAQLDLEAKNKLLAWLEAHIDEEEDALWEQDPQFQAELEEARAEIRAGDVVSLKELMDEINKDEL